MAEHVNNIANFFTTGGHTWVWGQPQIAAKTLTAVGAVGAARMNLLVGPRTGRIMGAAGGPALLKLTRTSRELAAWSMQKLIASILALRNAGTVMPWEDDAGQAGEYLVIDSFDVAGPMQFSGSGTMITCWQKYTATVIDLAYGS